MNRITLKKQYLILSFFLILTILFLGLAIEYYSTSSYLALLGSVLLSIILFSNFILKSQNTIINPFFVFSIMYSGYGFGAFYYATSNGQFGKFLSFMDLDRASIENGMIYALIFSIISYLCFTIGYCTFNRPISNNSIIVKNRFILFIENYYLLISSGLIFIGLLYWYWIAQVTAGGVIQLIIYFQAFVHLAEDTQVSTLPYHLYYAGIFIWLLGSLNKYQKVSIQFILFSIIGFLIGLSTGRISLAITYLMAQMLYYYFLFPVKRKKVVLLLALSILGAFVVFFLRILSNSIFIGGDFNFSEINLLDTIIGGGNVSDLQQLVIIFHTFDGSNALLGSSYFDWLRNTIGAQFGLKPSSVGLIIKELYIPNASGAPTPGAIGEAYANFLYLAPVIMLLVGAFFSIIHTKTLNSRNPFYLLIYSIFLARFVFIYPKVDSTMLVNFAWGAMPLILIIVPFKIYTDFTKKR